MIPSASLRLYIPIELQLARALGDELFLLVFFSAMDSRIEDDDDVCAMGVDS